MKRIYKQWLVTPKDGSLIAIYTGPCPWCDYYGSHLPTCDHSDWNLQRIADYWKAYEKIAQPMRTGKER